METSMTVRRQPIGAGRVERDHDDADRTRPTREQSHQRDRGARKDEPGTQRMGPKPLAAGIRCAH